MFLKIVIFNKKQKQMAWNTRNFGNEMKAFPRF